MFLLRSAFWLTLAFIMFAPHGVDLRQSAATATSQAVAAGQDIIRQQILSNPCDSIECIGGKAVLAAVVNKIPSVDTPMQDPSTPPVPFPRQKPDWMG